MIAATVFLSILNQNGIAFGSKSKGKLSPWSYAIQCERKWKHSFLSVEDCPDSTTLARGVNPCPVSADIDRERWGNSTFYKRHTYRQLRGKRLSSSWGPTRASLKLSGYPNNNTPRGLRGAAIGLRLRRETQGSQAPDETIAVLRPGSRFMFVFHEYWNCLLETLLRHRKRRKYVTGNAKCVQNIIHDSS